MEIKKIISALRKNWDKVSSYSSEEWSAGNPARGQCAVSSLIIQDYLGGDIVRFETQFDDKLEKHYANIVNGTLIDVTRSQFPPNTIFRESYPDMTNYRSMRERILSDVGTGQRYEYLKKKVVESIGYNDD